MAQKILVTGSNGLIGSEVALFFGKRGFAVHGLDNNQRAVFFGAQGDTRWNQQRVQNALPAFQHHELDIRKIEGVQHPRATFLQGSGRDLNSTFSAAFLRDRPRPLLVIEDADHFSETTRHVLDFFHPHLQVGEYIVIEDGIIADMGETQHYHGGPLRAISEFLQAHPQDYAMDTSYCDYFGYNMTWCLNGFLRRRHENMKT